MLTIIQTQRYDFVVQLDFFVEVFETTYSHHKKPFFFAFELFCPKKNLIKF